MGTFACERGAVVTFYQFILEHRDARGPSEGKRGNARLRANFINYARACVDFPSARYLDELEVYLANRSVSDDCLKGARLLWDSYDRFLKRRFVEEMSDVIPC
jgi:hypothetical protein